MRDFLNLMLRLRSEAQALRNVDKTSRSFRTCAKNLAKLVEECLAMWDRAECCTIEHPIRTQDLLREVWCKALLAIMPEGDAYLRDCPNCDIHTHMLLVGAALRDLSKSPHGETRVLMRLVCKALVPACDAASLAGSRPVPDYSPQMVEPEEPPPRGIPLRLVANNTKA